MIGQVKRLVAKRGIVVQREIKSGPEMSLPSTHRPTGASTSGA